MERLFETEESCVDLVSTPASAGPEGRGHLMAVFDPWTEDARSLERPGFGTEPFLARGFDVLAVKSRGNLWYHDLLDNADLRRALLSLPAYRSRTGYGSSMGGYGSLALARILRLDRVFCIAPQARLDLPGETRWPAERAEIARRFGWIRGLYTRDLAGLADIAVLYDPFDFDASHVVHIAGLCSPEAWHPVPLRHLGHEPGRSIGGRRILDAATAFATTGRRPVIRLSRAERRSDPGRNHRLSVALASRRWERSALARRAAIETAATALAMDPENDAYAMHLYALQRASGLLAEAVATLRRVSARHPHHDFANAESEMLMELDRLDESLEAAQRAIALAPAEARPPLRQHLARVLVARGAWLDAERSISTRCPRRALAA
ncbi:MAG: hypothetical protein AAFU49_19130 [Pseudomonadota bacterium]